ncbi:MAG: TIM barrel protein [Oscillospiraceae bacterium]|nr:TIM barrel protein [Oscillospiraceae bacterium]
MKFVTNLIAMDDFLGTYNDTNSLKQFCTENKLDGYEVICVGDFPKAITDDITVGLHLPFYNAWMDLYKGNFDVLDKEYGSRECWQGFYGGDSFEGMYRHLETELDFAQQLGAEYVVLHVCEIGTTETLTLDFAHDDKEVIRCLCEVVNRLFRNKNYTFRLLLENLWWKGFTFTDCEMTKYMLDSIEYPNKGIMLDIGHLMHTNKDLESWDDACRYIHSMLDLHADLLCYVKGIHLHGTLEGRFAKEFYLGGVEIKEDFYERFAQAYEYVTKVDAHLPFEHTGIKDIVKKINPDYVVYEFATDTLADKAEWIKKQNTFLNR